MIDLSIHQVSPLRTFRHVQSLIEARISPEPVRGKPDTTAETGITVAVGSGSVIS